MQRPPKPWRARCMPERSGSHGDSRSLASRTLWGVTCVAGDQGGVCRDLPSWVSHLLTPRSCFAGYTRDDQAMRETGPYTSPRPTA